MTPLITLRILCAALLLALSLPALAADGASGSPTKSSDPQGWAGSGQLGLAATTGNTRSQNLNAGLDLKFTGDNWIYHFDASALRSRGVISVSLPGPGGTPIDVNQYRVTANRYTFGGSAALVLDADNRLVSTMRYDHDNFSSYRYQAAVAVSWGHVLLKSAATDLDFEIGPGIKRYRVEGDLANHSAGIMRGALNYQQKLTDNTRIENHLLIEAASFDTFAENTTNLVVQMNKRLALKVGFQIRHNTKLNNTLLLNSSGGTAKTDTLLTTNLVYNF
jgi:putative salt-induced outer membrane protein